MTSRLRPKPSGVCGVRDLFNLEYEAMVRLAFVLTRNQHDAEEVVQDAFAEVHARWDELLNPGGYLRMCVVNGSRRKRSRTDRRRVIEQKASTGRLPSADVEYLADVLEQLPERHRVAIVLAYYAGWDSRQIAEALDCRVGTAKSLVHRGIKKLRKEIGDGE